eukprot:TRINITY_DN7398_c0_g1_i1.p2 TRINITY_DN7398_c0_g1~~TRINITY_DN7398_c0_g1_i1.p2  ORF type:complete len:124 (+),score=2.54 TRINITY_DN7398_c0_g1_i1:645-1016(+)
MTSSEYFLGNKELCLIHSKRLLILSQPQVSLTELIIRRSSIQSLQLLVPLQNIQRAKQRPNRGPIVLKREQSHSYLIKPLGRFLVIFIFDLFTEFERFTQTLPGLKVLTKLTPRTADEVMSIR